jgi:hypothetical protein
MARKKTGAKPTSAQLAAAVQLLAAEAEYLRSFGWAPHAPVSDGAPIYWTSVKGEHFKQEDAVREQKKRWVDLTQRNS